jgi:hypothetical protein
MQTQTIRTTLRLSSPRSRAYWHTQPIRFSRKERWAYVTPLPTSASGARHSAFALTPPPQVLVVYR